MDEQRLPINFEAVEQGLPSTSTSEEQRLPINIEAVEQGLPQTSKAVEDELPLLIDENGRTMDPHVTDVVETELPRLEGVHHPLVIATCQSRSGARDARENARKEPVDHRYDEMHVKFLIQMIPQ